jgi:hypothetical protein
MDMMDQGLHISIMAHMGIKTYELDWTSISQLFWSPGEQAEETLDVVTWEPCGKKQHRWPAKVWCLSLVKALVDVP